jgi:hypothetical protein
MWATSHYGQNLRAGTSCFGRKGQSVLSPGFGSYAFSMRRSTALMLTAPSFAEIICATTFVYLNVLGISLAPLMFLAFPFLIVAIAIASKNRESTRRSTWTLLAVAGVGQVATLIALGAFRG